MSSTRPPEDPQGPEYLEQGGGSRLASDPSETRSRRSRRPAIIGGAAVAGLALVGGGIWAATSFFATGPQPAEALPAGTLAYASIDLDPSGAQKIEAVRMLRKFPAIRDRIGLDAGDDLRERLFEELQKDAGCPDLDYATDIEPWLGDRAAVAAVDTGADQPSPVLVLAVTDADKADAGLVKLRDCATGDGSSGPGGAPTGGWAVEGDWVVVAQSDVVARKVADRAAVSSLADDEDFSQWTDAVGDPGIVTMYAAPAAGRYLAGDLGGLGSVLGGGTAEHTDMLVPSPARDALERFRGMAATVRFADGALELEMAAGTSSKALDGTGGDDLVATLPADTAAAIGVDLADGWFTDLVDQVASASGDGATAEDLLRRLSQESGLDLPDDAETLAGDSMALSLGSGIDLETLVNSTDARGVPVAAKVEGDPEAIGAVLDKLRARVPGQVADALGSDTSGHYVAIGPDPDYRSQVLQDGGLGSSKVYRDVVRGADRARALLFVDFDAGDWLARSAGGDQQVEETLRPLEGLGLTAWQEGRDAHLVLRLATD